MDKTLCPICGRSVPANLDGSPRRHGDCPGGSDLVGILFSDPMVRAILEGRKSVTRRMSDRWGRLRRGDELWVREAWGTGTRPDPFSGWIDVVEYRADESWFALPDPPPFDPEPHIGKGWRSPYHMPFAASRLRLRLTADPRREPVRDITDEEAIREGIEPNWAHGVPGWLPEEHGYLTWEGMANAARGMDCDEDGTVNGVPAYTSSPVEAFRSLWDHLHPGTWEFAEPWRLEFEREVDHAPTR